MRNLPALSRQRDVTCTIRHPGGTATGSVTIKRDTTGPTIALTGINTRNGNMIRTSGGIRPDYRITASDRLSGVTADPPVCTVTAHGRTYSIALQTASYLPIGTGVCTAKDNAGNIGTLTFDVV